MQTTSHKISWQFSKITFLFLSVFGIFVNLLFFLGWYQKEKSQLESDIGTAKTAAARRFIIPQQFTNFQIFTLSQPGLQEEMKQNSHPILQKFAILPLGGRYYLYHVFQDKIAFREVSSAIERQADLMISSGLLIILLSILIYLYSKRFVKKVLEDLVVLATHIKRLRASTLTQKVHFDHLAEGDEIKIVANAVNEMSEKIDLHIKSISDFVGFVSHEFKTPFMIIKSTIELAFATHDYKDALEKIDNQITQLNNMLESLLTLTSVSKQQTHETPIAPLLKDIISGLATIYPNTRIEYRGQTIAPFSPEHATILLRNLIENSCKYGKGVVQIVLSTQRIEIHDNGPGITEEEKKHMRDPFRQGHKHYEKKGVGLGLAIVQKICHTYTVRIHCESTLGHGTTFILSWDHGITPHRR